jgi:plasmid maintenance system killer protein
MPIKVEAKDKRIKLVMSAPQGATVRGLQPNESLRIRIRIDTLKVADSLKEASEANPQWRVHEWKGHKGYFSIDVLANTRLLFDYDDRTKVASNMIYDDPH